MPDMVHMPAWALSTQETDKTERNKDTMFSAQLRLLLASVAFIGLAYTTAASAEDVKIPQTAAEHEARAKTYQQQAEDYRKLAAEHKRMAAEYAKAHPPTKAMPNAPWLSKMAKHCEMLVKDYEKLATDAEKAAEYHSMRAKELQGG